MYRYGYRRYFFGKVSVPISSLLLKYRVPSSACIPLKTSVKSKKMLGSEIPGQDGVIFQGEFNSPLISSLVENSPESPPVGNQGPR